MLVYGHSKPFLPVVFDTVKLSSRLKLFLNSLISNFTVKKSYCNTGKDKWLVVSKVGYQWTAVTA
jgi:hypothetical protein